MIFDDQGAVLSAGSYAEGGAVVAGAPLKVSIDDPQSLIEQRLAAPERPLLLLLAEGLLVAGHVQSMSFRPTDGGRCVLWVAECRPASRFSPLRHTTCAPATVQTGRDSSRTRAPLRHTSDQSAHNAHDAGWEEEHDHA
ncbi:MAG: hypothetical protein AB7R89_01350 [Dehalococcoidia bacterium]